MPAGAGEGSAVRFLPRHQALRAHYEFPCGTCMGCRIAAQQNWATRCLHEAQMHPRNAFITLTFDDPSLTALEAMDPQRPRHSVALRDWQLFHKRMRKHYGNRSFRFMATAEYGGETLRPHYHALIFGQDYSEDRELWPESKTGNPFWTSPTLAKLWPHGTHLIGELTPTTASYVCRYTIKKLTGKELLEQRPWERVDGETGETWEVNPEFTTMSKNPGLGGTWFDKYATDLFPADHAIVAGKPRPVPQYYFNRLKQADRTTAARVQGLRHKLTAGQVADRTTKRRLSKEVITEAQQRQRMIDQLTKNQI